MLEFIRKRSASIVVKLLFGFLILSFVVWGVGDVIRGPTSGDVAAEIGDIRITLGEFDREFQREVARLTPLFGGRLDRQQARALGLVDGVLRDMVDRALFQIEARRLGIVVGDDQVRAEIQNNPAFQGGGRFDRLLFEQVLRANYLSEEAFIDRVRSDLLRGQLIGSLQAGSMAPTTLVNPLYRHRQERRVADVMVARDEGMPEPPAPDDETLAKYHADNARQFMAPEYRTLTFLTLLVDDLAKEIAVPEDKLREAFEARRQEFTTPERRRLEQMVLRDADAVRRASEQLATGRSFPEVAREIAGMEASAIELGWLQRQEMLPELADVAFGLALNVASRPVQSPLGWHVLRVTEIAPGSERTFAEIRAELAQQLAREMAIDGLYSMSRRLEDTLGGGATLEEAAARLNLRVTRIEAVDAAGNDPAGNPVDRLPPEPQFLSAAFETPVGSESPLGELGSEGYFVVRVDAAKPSALKPLTEVREEVLAAWRAERRAAAAEALAKDALDRLRGGATIEAVAAAIGLSVSRPEPFLRSANAADLPQPLVAALFGAKVGEAVMARGADGHFVAKLVEVRPADPASDRDGVEALRRQIAQRLAGDLLDEYANALRGRYAVRIDQRAVDSLF